MAGDRGTPASYRGRGHRDNAETIPETTQRQSEREHRRDTDATLRQVWRSPFRLLRTVAQRVYSRVRAGDGASSRTEVGTQRDGKV